MNIIQKLKGNLVVSCQALEGEPLHVPGYMTRMALAASLGGAAAVRANGPEDIASIKEKVGIPIIGIWKVVSPNSHVFITPTIEAAREVYASGADIIGVDSTFRKNTEGKWAWEIIQQIKAEMDVLVMADIATLEEGIKAAEEGADIVGTTLSGYTEDTKDVAMPNFDLIKQLSKKVSVPIMAEGQISTVAEAKRAFDAGADMITIGGSITRPQQITKTYVEALKDYHATKRSKDSALLDQYLRNTVYTIENILATQADKIIALAKQIAVRIKAGGTIHLVDPANSQQFAEEVFRETAGSKHVNTIPVPDGPAQDVAKQLLENHQLDKADVLLITSVSKANPVVLELVKAAKKQDLYTIVVMQKQSYPKGGEELALSDFFELTDAVLFNDAVDMPLVGLSNVLRNALLVETLLIETVLQLEQG